MGSDHRVVSARIRLNLRIHKTVRKTKYDWQKFSADPELQQRYTVAVRNRFQILVD